MNRVTIRRALLLAAAAGLSAAATGWLGAKENAVADAAQAVVATPVQDAPAVASDGAGAVSPPPLTRIAALERRPDDEHMKNLFAATTWHAEPPRSAKRQPEPPPSAPALPFVYLGKMIHDGTTTVFLSTQDRNFAVKPGDVIDNSWRIDSIQGPLLALTYLPLDTRQTMHIGDQN